MHETPLYNWTHPTKIHGDGFAAFAYGERFAETMVDRPTDVQPHPERTTFVHFERPKMWTQWPLIEVAMINPKLVMADGWGYGKALTKNIGIGGAQATAVRRKEGPQWTIVGDFEMRAASVFFGVSLLTLLEAVHLELDYAVTEMSSVLAGRKRLMQHLKIPIKPA